MSQSSYAECLEADLFTPASPASAPRSRAAPDAPLAAASGRVNPAAAAMPFMGLFDDVVEGVGDLDEHVPVDHPLKLATHLANDLDPERVLGGGRQNAQAAAMVAYELITGDVDGAQRRAEAMNTNNLEGENGGVIQALSMGSNLIVDPAATAARLTDDAASSGDRGMNIALGNYLGDEWFDVLESDYSTDGWTFVPDEE